MPISAEDRALVDRIAVGDEEAAREFVRRFEPRLKYCAHMAGMRNEDCDDIAQEVLLATIRQIRRREFRGESSLGTWVESIFRNVKVDCWRRAGTERKFIARGDPGDQSERTEMTSGTPFQVAPTSDQVAVISVREALSKIPAEYRAILLLNRSLGYTIEEISSRLNLTMGQVSRRLYTSERMFRRALSGDHPGRQARSSEKLLLENGEDV